MNKMYKFNKYFYTFIFSITSLFVFLFNYTPYDPRFLKGNDVIVNFFTEICESFNGFNIGYITLWLFIIYFYHNVYFDNKKHYSKNIFCIISSIIFALLTLVVKNYSIDNTLNALSSSNAQIFKSIVYVFGYYFMFYAVLKKLLGIKLNLNLENDNFIIKKINEHPIRCSLILIGLMWLPCIVFSFPGICNGDTTDQLGQFFHTEDSWTIRSINLLNEDVYLNKHHSVFHTVIMGMIVKIGKDLVSYNFGVGIFTILQSSLLLAIFCFMIKYMRNIKINSTLIFLSILFVGLNPTVVTYVVSAVKDTPNAIFNLLYVIFLLQIVRNFDSIYKNKLRISVLLIVMLLVMLLRNNGIYTILLSFPWLFLIYKKSFKKLLLTLLIPIFVFTLYDKILLPSYDVSNGSFREALSLPLMQLSRVVRDKSEVFTDKDIKIINNVFDFDVMKTGYDPDISDPIKETYNKDVTNEELKLFFGVWFKYFKKYPSIYLESVVNCTYGYFLPGKNRDIVYFKNYWFWKSEVFDINCIPAFTSVRFILNRLLHIYHVLPIFINNVAYYDLLLLFSCFYVIKKKMYKYLIPLTALLAVLLSCIASPLNGCFRYILPIVFSVPMIVSIDYLVYKESKDC